MSQRSSDPELTDIESALAGLVPVPSRLDRDKLMFDAGAASARQASQRRWVWPSIAATLAVGAGFRVAGPRHSAGPHVIEKVVVRFLTSTWPHSTSFGPAAAVAHLDSAEPLNEARSSEPPSLAASWLAKPDYQRVQELVLRLGLDALPGTSRRCCHGWTVDLIER